MPGKILIADPVATNRIVLKVKLSAGHFDVVQAATAQETLRLVRELRPDLIVTSNTLPDRDAAALINAVKARPELRTIPIVVLLEGEFGAEVYHRLLSRADAVITRPFNDALLLARLRGLMHRHNQLHDMRQQAATGTTGFAEEAAPLDLCGEVVILSPGGEAGAKSGAILLRGLGRHLRHRLRLGATEHPFATLANDDPAQVIVLYVPDVPRNVALQLLAGLRAAPNTRNAAVIAVLEDGADRAAVQLLDAGLSDVIVGETDLEELALRIEKQIHHARTMQALRDLLRDGVRAAVIDPLTGLYNRRYAMPFLQDLAGRGIDRRKGAGGCDFAVVLADLDHFKRINDRYGHAVGDEVLKRVAAVLRSGLRKEDMVARVGGEEFLLVMPETTPDHARATAAHLCALVAATPVHLPGTDTPVSVTISIGVVMGRDGIRAQTDHAGRADRLLELADDALYSAKARGRNTVTFGPRPAA